MNSTTWIAAVFGLLFAHSAATHHSPARYDFENEIELVGEITDVSWRNPHVAFTIAAVSQEGTTERWLLEGNSVPGMLQSGWAPDSLTTGDRIVVIAYPNRNPSRKEAAIKAVATADGAQLGDMRWLNEEQQQQLVARSQPLASGPGSSDFTGVWVPDLTTLPDPPMAVYTTLTELGETARQSADVNDDPTAHCLGPTFPMISSIQYGLTIRRDGDRLLMTYQFMDAERVVYLDGRNHPAASETSRSGHSIGRFEDGELIIDSRNFTFEPWGYARGVPSSEQKHVVERYSLLDNGLRLRVEYLLEDPVYLAAAERGVREYTYPAQQLLEPWNCDPEAAIRHLE